MNKSSSSPAAVIISVIALAFALSSFVLRKGDVPVNSGTAATETLAKIQDEKVLRVAYINYPPSAYKDPETGEVSGHFVDALREIMVGLNPEIEIEYVETNWADFSTTLTSGRADLSIAGTFTTVPRSRAVSFTRPIVYLGRGAVVKKSDDRWNAAKGIMQFDRPDIRIGVVNGEGSHEFVKSEFENLENIVVFDGADLSQCLAAVSAGQVDVGLSDSLETGKYVANHNDVIDVFSNVPQAVMPIAWSVRHDDVVWRAFLNTAITTLEAQGKLQEWEDNYDFKWAKPAFELKPR